MAGQAVELICQFIRDQGEGTQAAIRTDPDNRASIRVAEKCGFRQVQEFTSSTDSLPDGTPGVLRLYLRDLTVPGTAN